MTGLLLIMAGAVLLLGVVVYLLVNHLMSISPLVADIDDDDDEDDAEEPEDFVTEGPTEQASASAQELVVDALTGYPLDEECSFVVLWLPDEDARPIRRIELCVNDHTADQLAANGNLKTFAYGLRSLKGSAVQCTISENGEDLFLTCGELYELLFDGYHFDQRLAAIDECRRSQTQYGMPTLGEIAEPTSAPAVEHDTLVAGSGLLPVPSLDDIVPEFSGDDVPLDEPLDEGEHEELLPVGVSAEEEHALEEALAAGQADEPQVEEKFSIERLRAFAESLAEAEVAQVPASLDEEQAEGEDEESDLTTVVPLGRQHDDLPPGSLSWAGTTPIPQPVEIEPPADFDPNSISPALRD